MLSIASKEGNIHSTYTVPKNVRIQWRAYQPPRWKPTFTLGQHDTSEGLSHCFQNLGSNPSLLQGHTRGCPLVAVLSFKN